MATFALLAFPARLFGVWDLGAGDWTDVDSLAVWLVHLKARGAFFVGSSRKSVYSVACIGAYEDGLPDDVVGGLAVGAEAERVLELLARVWAEKGCLRDNVSHEGAEI